MFGFKLAMPIQIKQFLAMLGLCWRDSRVSIIARLFIVLAPIYWLCPFDLRPDWLPGGYIDDLCIVPMLLIAAWVVIPKVVFQDARKAAFLKQKAAAFGILYLTAAASIPGQAHAAQSIKTSPGIASSSYRARTGHGPVPTRVLLSSEERAGSLSDQRDSFACSVSPQSKQQADQVEAIARSHDSQQRNPVVLFGSHYLPASCAVEALLPAIEFAGDLPLTTHSPPVFLTTRGGQTQIYASEDASAAMLAASSACLSIEMPPHLAGGIFVGNLPKKLPFGEASCC